MKHSITVFGYKIYRNINLEEVEALAHSEVNHFIAQAGRNSLLSRVDSEIIHRYITEQRNALFLFIGDAQPARLKRFLECYKDTILIAGRRQSIDYIPTSLYGTNPQGQNMKKDKNIQSDEKNNKEKPEPYTLSELILISILVISVFITPISVLVFNTQLN